MLLLGVDARARLSASAPVLAIALVAVMWGVTFTLTAHTVTTLPAAQVVALRFGLATVVIALVTRRRAPLPPRLRRRGVVLGMLLGCGFLLQAHGLLTTDPATSGLLTGLLVVAAPVLEGMVFGRRHRPQVWSAVALATLGLVTISARPIGIGTGELLTMGAALLWATHLVLTSRWSEPEHTLGLARQQTLVVALLALVAATVRGGPWPPGSWSGVPVGTWLLVGLLAVVCTAAPMVLLTWGQARLDATRTAVILTAEPAVAALTGALSGVPLDGRTLAGGVLVVVAMTLAQVRFRAPIALTITRLVRG